MYACMRVLVHGDMDVWVYGYMVYECMVVCMYESISVQEYGYMIVWVYGDIVYECVLV